MILSYFLRVIRPAGSLIDAFLCPHLLSLVFIAGLCFGIPTTSQAQETLLEKRITIPRKSVTVYDALNIISTETGILFIYDSQVVNNEKKVRIVAENEPVTIVLERLFLDDEVGFKTVGKHVLIFQRQKGVRGLPGVDEKADTISPKIIKGYIYDDQNQDPIPYATIGIPGHNLGTITNTDGLFVLKLPSGIPATSLVVSHLGYVSQNLPVQLVTENEIKLYLQRRVISIQEVIIRYQDPNTILAKVLSNREFNYNKTPVHLTTFYREGVHKNGRIINYSEAVFRVFKSSFQMDASHDQVKVLKSRNILNTSERDTVQLKLKAGILAGLQLDIIKNLPDFLDPEQSGIYTFNYSDLVSYNDQDAYAITFTQNEINSETAFRGTLYIDRERYAILGADFEIDPEYLDDAAANLIQRKSRHLSVKFEKIAYSVSYKLVDGTYYLNHVRSDLQIKTRLKKRMSWDNFNTFMEVVTCSIDTIGVARFPRQDILKPDIVFSDTPVVYDPSFWGEYNYIAPEEQIEKALSRIIGKIEEIR